MNNTMFGEQLFHTKMENNLNVFYMPKKGFTKKYAVLATDYGSNDLSFISERSGEQINLNHGIAHFLEHKMFEQPDGSDAFGEFAKYGANANAFTNFNMTAYLFSTTDNFYGALEHLLSYVSLPHFTDENVKKRAGDYCSRDQNVRRQQRLATIFQYTQSDVCESSKQHRHRWNGGKHSSNHKRRAL